MLQKIIKNKELKKIVSENSLCDALIKTSMYQPGGLCAENIESMFDEMKEGGFLSDKQMAEGIDIVGSAYLMCLDVEKAAGLFQDASNTERVDDCIDVALWLGRPPSLIKKLVADEEKYKSFLHETALTRLSLVRDEGVRLNENDLEFIVSELKTFGFDPDEVIRKNLVDMDNKKSDNVIRKLLLSQYINDEILLNRFIDEYDHKEKRGREDLDSKIKVHCLLNDMSYIKKLQEGDFDIFFPIASNMFLVKNKDGFEVLKENIKLYTDFSKIDGYNKEREIYETIRHKNLVDYFGSMTLDGNEFLRLKFEKGKELGHYCKKGQLVGIKESLKIINELSGTLDFLQKNGVIYMDIKDKNILYDGSNIKLIDFGMAQKKEGALSDDDVFRSVLSTPEYVPPEWGKTFKVYNRSETFQLGVLAYKLMIGKHPFAKYGLGDDSSRESEIMAYSLSNRFNKISEDERLDKNPGVSLLLKSMLKKDHSKRMSVGDVYNMTNNLLRYGGLK